MKRLILLIAIIFTLTACSQKPDDVSQEIWDEGIQYTIYINKQIQDKKEIPESLSNSVIDFVKTDSEKLSGTEKKILRDLNNLTTNSLLVSISRLLGTEEDERLKEYEKSYEKLVETFGESNLKERNLNEKFVDGLIVENVAKTANKLEEERENFIKSTGVTLTADEVRYNMANNLDDKFLLEGDIELCDYYNYGYTNESKFFCGRVTPTDGNYSDSWYLYFHRETFDELYQGLLKKNVSFVRATAYIPSKSYDPNQGNMAGVHQAEWR